MTDPDQRVMNFTRGVAVGAHADQRRKYTGEPYVVHCFEVAMIMRQHRAPIWLQQAALLHDVIEDTPWTLARLAEVFAPEVVDAVDYMTERDHPGNRADRKKAERERLTTGLPGVQSLKLADLISNARSIAEHDPDFARVFLSEMRALHEVLTGAWPMMRRMALEELAKAEMRLLQHELERMEAEDGQG